MTNLFLARQALDERLHKLLQPRQTTCKDLRRQLTFCQQRRLPRLKFLFLKTCIHADTPFAKRGSILNCERY